MSKQRRVWLVYALLLLAAFGFRLFIARRLPNDNPDDGRVYSQIARNVLEQHVYSHATEAPYSPSFIRLPGYPLLLATIYSVFGHNNNSAVRIAQALIDTATCWLIALVAFEWAPEKRKRAASIAALALAAACPFTAIYVATILTEVPTNFLAVAMCLGATLALKAPTRKLAFTWWTINGLICGIAVLFRPDSGLFAAAIGISIVISSVVTTFRENPLGPLPAKAKTLFQGVCRSVPPGAVFSLAFCLALVPWTIRNERVFHLFQPLAPSHGEMPGEFVPRGYQLWLRTWLDDERYIGPLLWSLDASPIKVDDLPDSAFDSEQERDRVEALLQKYNHPVDAQTMPEENAAANSQIPQAATDNKIPPGGVPQPSPSAEEPTREDEEDHGDEQDTEQSDEEESQNQQDVEMTPEIDAGFAQIAHERIARSHIRYLVLLPLRRAATMWLDTHSQYYPFEGELLPFEDLDYQIHQQFWLPLFAALTWIYTLLGIAGGWLLWRSGSFATRRWVVLACLIIFLRLGFFSTLENPEPRYAVEVFPFLAILGGVAIGEILGLVRSRKSGVKV